MANDYPARGDRTAVAHIHEHLARPALEMMERNMHAEITNAEDAVFTV